MADGRLTNPQRVQLAAAISADKMVKIALAYFKLSDTDVKNIERDFPSAEAQSREMLTKWLYKNPDNQVQVKESTH